MPLDALSSGYLGPADVVTSFGEDGTSTVVIRIPYSERCDSTRLADNHILYEPRGAHSCNQEDLVVCRNKPTGFIATHGFNDQLGHIRMATCHQDHEDTLD